MASNGFIIRNAVDAGSALDLAEPDALDFNLLSRNRFGVVSGCKVSLSGWNATVAPGVVVVDDLLVPTGGQVTLPTSSQSPRFDLITVDQGGTVGYVRGTPSPNPIFPDFDDTVVVLASIYITPGSTAPDPVRDITDKRLMLPQRYLSTVNTGDLLANYASTPALVARYTVAADGRTEWASDTRIFRSGAKMLRVEDSLDVAQSLSANSGVFNTGLTVTGDISAGNLLHGQGPPTAPGTPGDLYQDQRAPGGVWSYEDNTWGHLSTTPIPVGTVIQCLAPSESPGWLMLNGQTIDKVKSGGLWNVFPEWRQDANIMQLPDARGRFLQMGSPGSIGSTGGSTTATVNIANMPAHTHIDRDSGGSVTTTYSGAHYHLANIFSAGEHSHTTDPGQGWHSHDINDPNHFHEGVDGGAGGGFIGAMWGGTRRLDGPFNDGSHPVSVEIVDNTKPSPSHVSVVPGGTHQHWTNTVPPHTHAIDIQSSTTSHNHGISERSVGDGQPIDTMPPYLVVNYLIKT